MIFCVLSANRFDHQEQITDSIDASNLCHVSVEQATDWKVDDPQGKHRHQGR